MSIKFKNLSNGEYLLMVTIEALSNTTLNLFCQHRHFLYHSIEMKQGEKISGEFAVAIKNADFQKQDNYRDNCCELNFEGNVIVDATLVTHPFSTIYTLGDSTVCNQESFGAGPLYRCGGWGQAMSMYLGTKYAVSNHAEQGTHTQDCLSCHLPPVLDALKVGDIVMCQFGHNDQKNSFLDAFGGYFENIVKIGTLVKKKGADFIVCTPINRLIYIDGKINTYLDPWRDAAKKASEVLGVKCIDLHTFTTNLYHEMGDDAENLFYHSPDLDRTHPNDYGAIKIAQFVSSELE